MFKFCILWISALLTVGNCASAWAGWVDGQARMVVGSAPLDEIRKVAIKNAVADAAFKAGAVLRAEDITLNGLLVESTISLKAHNEIKRIEVLDEQLENGVLSVWVQVDLSTFEKCNQTAYKQTIIVSQITMQNPRQASIGSLFLLGKHVTKRIVQQLNVQLPGVTTELLNQPFTLKSAIQGTEPSEIASKAEYLARTYGAQYTLYGVIRDLSVFDEIEKRGFIDSKEQRRSFTLRLYLIDNFLKKHVFEKSYHTESAWPFGLTQELDLNSNLFWQSEFGRSLLNQITSAMMDISEAIRCRKALLPIMSINSQGAWITSGTQSGIKLGDVFNLYRQSTSTFGSSISVLNRIKENEMEVVVVDEFSALLRPINFTQTSQPRLYDLLSPSL